MKFWNYIFLITIMFSTCSSMTPIYNYSAIEKNTKGPVKSIHDLNEQNLFEFNRSKKIISHTFPEGHKYIFKYNALCKQIAEEHYNEKGYLTLIDINIYSTKKKLSWYQKHKLKLKYMHKLETKYKNNVYYTHTFIKDSIHTTTIFDSYFKPKQKTIEMYDKNNNLIQWTGHDPFSRFDKIQYLYDQSNNLIEKSKYKDGELKELDFTSYNSMNLATSFCTYRAISDYYEHVIFEYNNSYFLIKSYTGPDSESEDMKMFFEYKNNVYDQYGNWLKYDKYINGVFSETHIREITYFE